MVGRWESLRCLKLVGYECELLQLSDHEPSTSRAEMFTNLSSLCIRSSITVLELFWKLYLSSPVKPLSKLDCILIDIPESAHQLDFISYLQATLQSMSITIHRSGETVLPDGYLSGIIPCKKLTELQIFRPVYPGVNIDEDLGISP